MYLLGVCLAERDTAAQSAALEQLIRTRKLHFDSPEGLAATLLEADLLRAAGRPAEAVAAYRLALSAAGTAVEYHNPWVPLAEFRGRVVAAFEDLCDGGQFDHAVELLDGFRPIFPHLRTLELTAQTAGRWGDALIRSGAHLPESQARPLQQRARQHFRRAGYAFLQLAEAHRASRRYPDDLWNSAQSLLKGHDFQTARRLLKQYLDEPARPWRAQALVALGQANLALGHVDESAAALQECIEFHPRDPATYTARLWCSKAYVEQGAYDKAEALLRNNLDSDSLTPTSSEWRDSLFALGQLLLTQQRHQEAVKHLQEAVARYPATPRATHGIHLIAQAYREAAKEPQQRLREAAVQTVRAASRREVGQLLEQALQYYQQVQTMLLGREEQSELTALDSAMLRNCLLARGSILFDLARYDEAIEVYSNAATRYQNEPVVLETFVQIAYCYRRQSKLVEARGAVEQAKVVLQQLPPDEDFKVTTNYSRDEWVTLLNRLSS
ncbi:MAG: hypothetical protein A2W31_05950 [Planctomycetes bacterium RBG_16_64_10]|nr:MAG: hypothetical protein A2W31_05950 [Planctomycetes bacterium RBG_16_64_10]